MINEASLVHGSELFIGPAGTAKIATGGTSVGIVTSIGDNTATQTVTPVQPLGAANPIKRAGAIDPGQISFTCVTKDNDPGQIAVKAAHRSTSQFPYYLEKNGVVIRNGIGYVMDYSDNAGEHGAMFMINFTFDLTDYHEAP